MAWTLEGLLRASSIDAQLRAASTDVEIGGLAYDSRRVARGDLFCCWPGSNVDGHDFAAGAVRAGAHALLVERFVDVDVPQARVERVHPVLGPLAAAFFGHPSRQLDVAAVTGTNGKTTVTYLLESIARAAERTPGVIGTVSRRFPGAEEPAPRNTPEAPDVQGLFRRMADAGVDLVALEATSDGLAAGRLKGTAARTAGFTNLTQDHLNTHGSMEAYFDAKALLFEDGYTSRAVINVDDDYGRKLRARVGTSLDVLTYGMDEGDISCDRWELTRSGTRARLRTPSGAIEIATSLVGRYNVANCMCASGMALQCDIDPGDIARGIEALATVPGRLETVDAGQPFLAVVDYAHTPDALENVLHACRELARSSGQDGRVISVFGCGGDRDKAKRPLMGEVSARLADLTIVTSDNPRSEDPDAVVAEVAVGAARRGGAYRTVVDRRSAIAEAIAEARPGDVVLVAGKGHEQGQQFADRTIPFDDRDVVREALRNAAAAGTAS